MWDMTNGLMVTYDAYVLLGRIEEFLLLENVLEASESDASNEHQQREKRASTKESNVYFKKEVNICLPHLTCAKNHRGDEFVLQDINFVAPSKSLTVITGPVGSGKSTLLLAIAGEISNTNSTIDYQGSVIYLPQTAWVFSVTIKENILFGQPYAESKYERIIDVCALKEDFQQLPDGDQTVVGERGEQQHMKNADEVVVLYKGEELDKGRYIDLHEKGVISATVDPLYKATLKDETQPSETFFWEDKEKHDDAEKCQKVHPLPNEARSWQIAKEDPYAGLALVYVIQTLGQTQYTVRKVSEVEDYMTSVERVMTYAELDWEPGYEEERQPPKDWLRRGSIVFRDVSLTYYTEGLQVLKKINFSIKGRESIGVAGRTGAGKSSFVAALMRMPDANGEIIIDDVPIKEISSRDLRPSSIANCLEHGANVSVGERQLICLPRVLLQRSKIVVLDEPTVHVDPDTEQTIWNVVRDKLKESTVITIAHRLNTIRDCKRILVLRDGKVEGFDKLDSVMNYD
ncbi:Multidrug resistance-associated protein 4 [Stylophora pistillata]|uniref:Multidrug resistance-associated protein 4 n=1 Tax=Stylophora pistillata TaxID=50429 RepID=A0A2B4S333_STYPI|nr:Multidrug resistance-associated protein 4 [Stylophora pistillata]